MPYKIRRNGQLYDPQHKRAATPAERTRLGIPKTCIPDKHGDCTVHTEIKP